MEEDIELLKLKAAILDRVELIEKLQYEINELQKRKTILLKKRSMEPAPAVESKEQTTQVVKG